MQNIEEIYKNYFQTVNRYLFCLTHDNDIAEDLTQETFCKAIKNIDTFKGNCKISVWLCEIAKNLWYDYLRKNKCIKIVNEDELSFIHSIETTEETVISNENISNFYKLICSLDEQTKKVFDLRMTGNLSFKEIATIMNKTESWARTVFYRGKQKIKEERKNERL